MRLRELERAVPLMLFSTASVLEGSFESVDDDDKDVEDEGRALTGAFRLTVRSDLLGEKIGMSEEVGAETEV